MKNLLKLHEAIAVVLLNKPKHTETIQEIAKEINRRRLYVRKDGTQLPAYQVMMRSKLSKGKYAHIFKFIIPDKVKIM
jgi:predicted transcriptional regulator